MGGDYPPILSSAEQYASWKLKVTMWAAGSSVEVKKQAPRAIGRISEPGGADHAHRLPMDKLCKETGLQYLIDELDKYYREDTSQTVVLAIEHLKKWIRPDDMDMNKYIAEFILRHNKLKEVIAEQDTNDEKDFAYGDKVLAYHLLEQSNISETDQKLIKAAIGNSGFSFASTKEALQRVFGDRVINIGATSSSITGASANSSMIKVKEEPQETFYAKKSRRSKSRKRETSSSEGSSESTNSESSSEGEAAFYQNHYHKNKYYKDNRKHGKHSKGYGHDGSYRHDSRSWREEKNKSCNEENPTDKKGRVLRCRICDSKMHFVDACPHKSKSSSAMLQSTFENQMCLKVDEDFEFAQTFLVARDTFNSAVIDTGAVRNVCGSTWFNEYIKALPKKSEVPHPERRPRNKLSVWRRKVNQIISACVHSSTHL